MDGGDGSITVQIATATGKPLITATMPDLREALSEHAYLLEEVEEFVEVLCCFLGAEKPEKVRARPELTRENPRKSQSGAVLMGTGVVALRQNKPGDGTFRSTLASSAADAAEQHVW